MASKATTGCPDRHLASISRRLMRGGPIDEAPDLIGTSGYGPLGRRRQMIDMTWSKIRLGNQDGRPEYLFGVLTSGRREPFASRPALRRLIDAVAAGTGGPVFEETYSKAARECSQQNRYRKGVMK